MGKGFDQLIELKDDSLGYVKLRWTSIRLAAVDKLSSLLSKAFGYLLFLALIFIALAFLMVALALWLGEVLGHYSLGFLVSGGAFVISAVIIYFAGYKFVSGTLVRFFMDLLFSADKDGDYGTQE